MKAERPVKKIGKYEVIERLGAGGVGVVYKAMDPFVQREVAIKLIPMSRAEGSGELVSEAAFLSEARANGLLLHRNIAALHDAGVDAGSYYLVMEFVRGSSLTEFCSMSGPRLPVPKVRDIAMSSALALHCAHSHGVFHRDIKPSNIVLAADGEAKLVDFGIAALLEDNKTRVDFVTGTPAYMAPEQLQGARATPSSDLYSLGIVLYELLAGQRPFYTLSDAELMAAIGVQTPPPLNSIAPQVPPGLAAIIDRMIQPEPAQRFHTAMDVVQALLQLSERRKSPRTRGIVPEEAQQQLKRQKILATMNKEQLAEVLAGAEFTRYPAGEVIIAEGVKGRALYLVVKGSVSVNKGGKVIARIDAGECFGEVGALWDERHSATVTADKATTVMKVYNQVMEKMSPGTQLELYKSLCRTLSYRLRVTTARLASQH